MDRLSFFEFREFQISKSSDEFKKIESDNGKQTYFNELSEVMYFKISEQI